MRKRDYFTLVRHALRGNPLRSTLTLLGIVIGSGAIVLLAGLLQSGEEALLQTSQQAAETDLIAISSKESPESQKRRATRDLSHWDARALRDTPLLGGIRVTEESTKEGLATWKGVEKRARLVAVNPGDELMYRLELHKGRFLRDDDMISTSRACVIGYEIWKDLFYKAEKLSELRLAIAGEVWNVVGVLAAKPIMGHSNGTWMWDRKALVPRTTFKALFSGGTKLDRIYLRLLGLDRGGEADHIKRIAKELLTRRHLGVANVRVGDDDGKDSQGKLIVQVIELLLFCTALLALCVGGINIMNIMLVTVTERTREIGVRRAIGAPPQAIALQFLLEACFISGVGGVIGVASGIGLLRLAALILSHVLGNWTFHIAWWSVGLGFSLSVLTGAVFGFFPALRAARVNPIDALRFE